MILRTSSMLGNHHHYLMQNIFITPKQSLPIPPLPQLQATTNPLSGFIALTTVDISDKCNHAIYDLLCLAFFR